MVSSEPSANGLLLSLDIAQAQLLLSVYKSYTFEVT